MLLHLLQPYELKEFQPVYSKIRSDCSSQFSATGLQQMRLIVSMLSSSIPGTQPTLPPLCHPPSESTRSNMVPYTAEDYKRDVKLKSTFCSSRHTVVLTPAMPPPHPKKLAEQLLKINKHDKSVSEKMSAEKNRDGKVMKKEQSDATIPDNPVPNQLPVTVEGDDSEIKQCDETACSGYNNASSLEKLGRGLVENSSHNPSRKESGTKRPHTVYSNSSSHVIDDSLTSYQVPILTHSTPVRGDECGAGEVVEASKDDQGSDSEIKLSGESSREQSCTPVRKKNNIARPRVCSPPNYIYVYSYMFLYTDYLHLTHTHMRSSPSHQSIHSQGELHPSWKDPHQTTHTDSKSTSQHCQEHVTFMK